VSDPRGLHRDAMDLADRAVLARREGRESDAAEQFRRAFEMESLAAEIFRDKIDVEPTRSVLYRSAASLALDCGDFRSAEKLIAAALMGDPPEQIANELRDLMEMVHFQRHLDLRGIKLEFDEFQLSIEGSGVGFGIAPAEQFVSRVRDIESMIYRTAERQQRRPFREAGRRKKSLDESLQLYVSVPRAASFAVTFRVGASKQLEFFEKSLPSDVVREVLDCIELVDCGDLEALQMRIGDEAYLRNFLALAQKIAPDGEVVRSIGFTAGQIEGERRVALRVPSHKIVTPPQAYVQSNERKRLFVASLVTDSVEVVITGRLLKADAKELENGQIEVRTPDGHIEVINVPRGMMRDVVRPHFEEDVIVYCTQMGSTINLERIRAAEE
jgi:hypothetical protein